VKYYIKKLTKNELGISSDGRIARGRFLYISKACEEFFPHLSKLVTNDNVLLQVYPPFSNSKVYTSYVYHNDFYTISNGTRDEYRLYLNQELDPDRNYFKVDDIVVFERLEVLEKATEEIPKTIPLYVLYRYQSVDLNYNRLLKLIEASPIKGNHALVEDSIEFLPFRDINFEESNIIIPEEIKQQVAIQQEEEQDRAELGVEEIRGASLFNSVSFRDFVMYAYNYKCAITSTSFQYKNFNNLEAAHIQPRAHTGNYLPCNGIALSRDMHWAFDKGLFTVDDDYRIIVHNAVDGTPLTDHHLKQITVPVETYFQPERKFLKHHRENVFGLFLHSGSIRMLK
jgi:hypothetical protein